jgi:predicted nucleic acid-binding protein
MVHEPADAAVTSLPGIGDSLRAATALVHTFVVVTRNTQDFRKAHVKVLGAIALRSRSKTHLQSMPGRYTF